MIVAFQTLLLSILMRTAAVLLMISFSILSFFPTERPVRTIKRRPWLHFAVLQLVVDLNRVDAQSS